MFHVMGSNGRVSPPHVEFEDRSAIPDDDLLQRLDETFAELAVLRTRCRQALAEVAGWRTHLAGDPTAAGVFARERAPTRVTSPLRIVRASFA